MAEKMFKACIEYRKNTQLNNKKSDLIMDKRTK